MKKLSTHKRYANLNENQRFAVDNTEGPLLVIAGPGSGKTELLSLRTARIIERHDIPLSSILCITFTNAATFNMRERLKGLIGEESNKISIYTFHSFCLEIIDSYSELFFSEVKFDLADEFVKLEIIEDVLKELSFDDPLKKFNQKGGFLYLQDIERSIFYLQENAVSCEEFASKLKENKGEIKEINKVIHNNLSDRVSKKTISSLKDFFKEKKIKESVDGFPKLSDVIFRMLEKVILTEETRELSEWKSKMTKRENGKLVIKETAQIKKLDSLVFIYKRYCEEIKKRGYYTFSDIILEVVLELERNEDLRRDIQEKYLYIQVDEFQDTNGGQMKLLNLITSDTPENKPNICVVGDDDQAIYQFQGADISNILNFKKRYKDVKTVVLLKNYRSNQKIIDQSRDVVLRAEERLEEKFKEISKNLKSGNNNDGNVILNSFLNKEEQFSFIVNEIKRKKISPKDIAVICRTHREIKEIVPYFYASEIPTVIERRENILEKEPIKEIINILKFSYFLFKKEDYSAESLFPEILTYPFLKIKKEKIWQLASESQKRKISWMEYILNDKDLRNSGKYFLEIASLLKYSSIENVLDFIINNKNPNLKSFYFSKEKEEAEYLSFLFSLKCFLRAIKNHQKKKIIQIEDVISFVEFYEKNDLAILDKNPLELKESGVSLVTAHSVKGREFDTVFILNCHQDAWGKEKKNRKISFPSNMPIERAGNKRDERIRLFYVAMTRAKRYLYLLNYRKNYEERDVSSLEFLKQPFEEKKENINKEAFEISFKNSDLFSFPSTGKSLLSSLVEEYKLSATGFNKFLNVVNAGPQIFFEENILRFPQKKTKYSSYGTAVHSLIKEIYRVLKNEKRIISEKEFFNIFKIFLEKERLPKDDFQEMLKRGKKELRYFQKNKIKDFSPEDIIEKDFRNQLCVINNVIITGKIDKMRVRGGNIDVFDYKTGHPLVSWNEKDENKKIRVWQYKNQLIFYKLLIEYSRDFSKYKVESGFLDFVSSRENSALELKIEKNDVERIEKLIGVIGQKISSLEFPPIKKKTFKEIIRFENDLLEGKI
jgi:DNA helicase II / ATP-dependent DNA helicase PcrA